MTSTLNISPDPNILTVLASTPLKPVDALCELIDNALDSFLAAKRAGLHIESRWVRITIPKPSQIDNREGVIRVVDNGMGLDQEGLEGAGAGIRGAVLHGAPRVQLLGKQVRGPCRPSGYDDVAPFQAGAWQPTEGTGRFGGGGRHH